LAFCKFMSICRAKLRLDADNHVVFEGEERANVAAEAVVKATNVHHEGTYVTEKHAEKV
jgi:hypothetical protein